MSWPWADLTSSHVASLANSGSFEKAVNLVQARAVKVLICCADGAVELSVQSEKGNDVYEVRLDQKKTGAFFAKCNCHDFRRRGGLCKHGAAGMLHVIHNMASLHMANGIPAAALHPKDKAEVASEYGRDIATPARKRPHPDRCVKQARADECEASSELARLPPVPKPCFPQRRSGAKEARGADESSVNTGIEQKKRCRCLKAAMAKRMLQHHADKGDDSAFASELNRWTGPLEDIQSLLHRSVAGDDEKGSLVITSLILDRPEASDAINSACDTNGRGLLHAAVASQRLELCRMLLQRNADLNITDSSGLTPMDLAKTRKIDVSNGKLEDPIVVLLQQLRAHGA